MRVAVVIGTYGSWEWRDLAMSRAFPSAHEQAQTFAVHHAHDGGTLATARNEGAAQAIEEGADWLVFLDGDDELEAGYVSALYRAAFDLPSGSEVLLTPRVRYVARPGRVAAPRFHEERPYQDGNWLVIGTAISSRLFRHVGGFEEWPMYEDWALFARAQKAGATVRRVPDAIYRAWRRPGGSSRNHAGGRNAKLAAHDAIRRAVFPELYEEETCTS